MKSTFSPTEPKVWLCRKDKELLMFFTKPFKKDDYNVVTYGPYSEDYFINIDPNLFPFVTVDNSPFEIDLIELINIKYE